MPQVTFFPMPSEIVDITNSDNAIVTTLEAYDFEEGQRVRFIVPVEYGMQINNIQTHITKIDDTHFYANIDTRQMDIFSVPPVFYTYPEPAQVIAVGGPGNNLASQNLGTL